VAGEGASYVFNPAGQVMNFTGLLCLFDGQGPCANPVKDSQRTKTSADTGRTLSLVWGTKTLPGYVDATERWYQMLLSSAGAVVEPGL
jgi:hypothetical protein